MVNWFSNQKSKLCGKTLHLSCARSLMASVYKGAVPIAGAGKNLIGFCGECFPRMEAARIVEPEVEQPPAEAEHGARDP